MRCFLSLTLANSLLWCSQKVLLHFQVSSHLVDPVTKSVKPSTSSSDVSSRKNSTPDSGVGSSNGNKKLDVPTPRMSFSPADSLDSQVTLVSGVHNNASETSNKTSNAAFEKSLPDGSVEVTYPNGNRKVVSADGRGVKVHYYNGDVKESLAGGLVKYFYAETKTWHLTYPDRKEVLQFSK